MDHIIQDPPFSTNLVPLGHFFRWDFQSLNFQYRAFISICYLSILMQCLAFRKRPPSYYACLQNEQRWVAQDRKNNPQRSWIVITAEPTKPNYSYRPRWIHMPRKLDKPNLFYLSNACRVQRRLLSSTGTTYGLRHLLDLIYSTLLFWFFLALCSLSSVEYTTGTMFIPPPYFLLCQAIQFIGFRDLKPHRWFISRRSYLNASQIELPNEK